MRFAAIVALACLCAGGAAAAMPGPSEVVGRFDDVLLNVMQNAAALGIKGRYQKLEPVVLATFDVPFMTRLSIGPLWAKGSPREAACLQGLLPLYAATYANRFDDYSGEKFEVLGEQRLKHGTLVRTDIVKSDGDKVAINYVLHDNDTAWQIRDVYLSGTISELATRRSDFTSTLRSGGIEALIVRLNEKADDLLAH